MPYRSNRELPENVRGVLPEEAQSIFREAFNAAVGNGDPEEVAFKKAWVAVKNAGYVRGDDGVWVKKHSLCYFSVNLNELRMLSDVGEGTEEPNAIMPLFRLSRFTHPIYGEIVFDEEKLIQIVNNFYSGVVGDEIPVNVGHMRSEGAVGWVKDLERDGNVVLAKVWFNRKGRELIADRQFRYASIEYFDNFVDYETGKRLGTVLVGVALTNNPFILRQRPVEPLSFDIGDIMSIGDMGNLYTKADEQGGITSMADVRDNAEPVGEAVVQVSSDNGGVLLSAEEYRKLVDERDSLRRVAEVMKRDMMELRLGAVVSQAESRLEDGRRLSPGVIDWAREFVHLMVEDGRVLEDGQLASRVIEMIGKLLQSVVPCTVPVVSNVESNVSPNPYQAGEKEDYNIQEWVKRFWNN